MPAKRIGIDIGGTNIRIGVLEGNQIGYFKLEKIEPNLSEQEILDQLANMIEPALSEDIVGIGIGVPSIVDVKKGIVYDTTNIPSWKEVYLKDFIENKFMVPTLVNNDANCFTLGETHFGKAPKGEYVVGLISGTGLGIGICINGQLYSGRNCGAGEVGELPYLDGVYEDYCSGHFFQSKYQSTGETLFTQALRSDSNAIKAFQDYGQHLGQVIIAIMLTYDPDTIILGGSVSKSFDLFKDSMNETVNTFKYQRSLKNLRIRVSNLEHASMYGAAKLVDQYIN